MNFISEIVEGEVLCHAKSQESYSRAEERTVARRGATPAKVEVMEKPKTGFFIRNL
jgi:hypothetical protein